MLMNNEQQRDDVLISNEVDDSINDSKVILGNFNDVCNSLMNTKETETEEIFQPTPPSKKPITEIEIEDITNDQTSQTTDNSLPPITNPLIHLNENSEENVGRLSLFIIRFISLLDWRIHDLYYSPYFVIPSVLNPKNFSDSGRNPFGFYLLEQFMELIPNDPNPLSSVERALYRKNFDTKKVYQSEKLPDFKLEDYKNICDALKQHTIRIPPEFTILHELNALYYATSENVDAVNYFKNHSFTYPRVSIIAKIFMSILASEAACERMFSLAGHFITKFRNRMSTIRIEQFALNKINCTHASSKKKKVQKK